MKTKLPPKKEFKAIVVKATNIKMATLEEVQKKLLEFDFPNLEILAVSELLRKRKSGKLFLAKDFKSPRIYPSFDVPNKLIVRATLTLADVEMYISFSVFINKKKGKKQTIVWVQPSSDKV